MSTRHHSGFPLTQKVQGEVWEFCWFSGENSMYYQTEQLLLQARSVTSYFWLFGLFIVLLFLY